ncbi:MAG: CPBP family intramembrane glutamic endopeptidase [Segniliparus sp.]|uniref:CPBP family intramembrane glutamic endopeptidase n=1 Tax=Segniliparus sp. TaxID=2804064 RepID=UPI003F2CC6DB
MGHIEDARRAGPERVREKPLRVELAVVLLVTFGASALSAVLSLADASLSAGGIGAQRVTLNAPALHIAVLDIGRDLVYAAHLAAFAGLALVLLARDAAAPSLLEALDRIGLRWERSRGAARDLGSGAGLAALIGVPGLVLYLLAHRFGLAPTVAPAQGYPWWRAPELVLLAFANGLAEEVVVVGYLVTRLRQLRVSPCAALCASALLRGCYHLYQGVPAGLGNVAMGLLFGWAWLRWGRLVPLVVAHTLIDSVAFVGYPLLHGHVSWLP